MLLFLYIPFVNTINVSLTCWLIGLEVYVISENFQIELLMRIESLKKNKIKNSTISTCEHVIVSDQEPVPPCLLVHPRYLVLRFLMKEFSDGGKN